MKMTKKHINVQDFMNMGYSSQAAADIVQAIQEGGATGRYVAGEDIPANRLVDLDAGEIKMGVGDGKVFGASIASIANGEKGVVQTEGPVFIDAATDFSKGDLVACGPGGYAGVHQLIELYLGGVSWQGIRGTDAQDDLVQTNLPAKIQAVCAGDETGHKMVVYGLVGTNFVKEEVDLGVADTYLSTNTFDTVFAIDFPDDAVGNIDVQTNDGNAIIAATISGGATARFYGAIVPGSIDPKGIQVEIKAQAATNNANVVLMGTGPDGNEQFETITMNDDTFVDSANSWRTLDYVLIGADGLVWNVGNESRYIWRTKIGVPRGRAVSDLSGVGKIEVTIDSGISNIQLISPRLGATGDEFEMSPDNELEYDLARSRWEGVVEGMMVLDPTTPSTQITGAGDTEWRIKITSGLLKGGDNDLGEKYFTEQDDFVVHNGSKLIDNGQYITALLVADVTLSDPLCKVIMGPAVSADYSAEAWKAKIASYRMSIYDPSNSSDIIEAFNATNALAVSQIGVPRWDDGVNYKYNWLPIALLILQRTGDTSLSQYAINSCRVKVGRTVNSRSEQIQRTKDNSLMAIYTGVKRILGF